MSTHTVPARYLGTVYLLHFDRPYRHARHYIGWAKDLNARLAQHATGQGARLLQVVAAEGITWTLARTWRGTRHRERRIKRMGDEDRAAAMAAGLRHLAAMLTDNPHLTQVLGLNFNKMLVSVGHSDVPAREEMLAFARAGLASGATVTEHNNDTWAGVDVAFGPVGLHVYAAVEKVHDVTRIVEYTPRSILAEIATAHGGTETGAAA